MTTSGKKKKSPFKVIVQHNPRGLLDDFYRSHGLAKLIEWSKLQEWWDPWKRNFKSSSDQTINEFLDTLQSPVNLIESAFHWSLTDEGRQYWTEAHNALLRHISEEFQPFLIGIRNRISKENQPFTISKEQFCELVGYGESIFTDDFRLEDLCSKVGVNLEIDSRTKSLIFSL